MIDLRASSTFLHFFMAKLYSFPGVEGGNQIHIKACMIQESKITFLLISHMKIDYSLGTIIVTASTKVVYPILSSPTIPTVNQCSFANKPNIAQRICLLFYESCFPGLQSLHFPEHLPGVRF
jgi:hypothetical protein